MQRMQPGRRLAGFYQFSTVLARIMRNDNAIAINNTTQIDLQGQAASESDGHRHISGTSGQLQFVRGAYASKGGKSFICLSSTYEKRDERRSRIVLDLTSARSWSGRLMSTGGFPVA
ncbi:MAG TPA: acetyl-CoA hydrolase/transferase C-terminal domain-containing protein [Bryobacteraceae bacterium]|nr:acetyl-CoA hydrolase/transferase C-terminal domain-containing protein [Bryobacteraceae bacterium]